MGEGKGDTKQSDAETSEAPATHTLTFSEVFSTETRAVTAQPEKRRTDRLSIGREESSASLGKKVGLALSGGGIRSAAFSLGVLQAFSANKAFKSIDFLSSVSGGGYTGASLTAAMQRNGGVFPFDVTSDQADGKDSLDAADIADSDAVKTMRDHSRYLMPNGKLDLVVSFGIILRGLAVNATMVAAAVFFFAALTLFLNPSREALLEPWLFRLVGEPAWLVGLVGRHLIFTKIFSALFVGWLVVWAIWRSIRISPDASGGAFSDPGSWSAKSTGACIIALAGVFITEIQVPIISMTLTLLVDPAGFQKSWSWLPKLITTLATGTGALALTWRWLVGQVQLAGKDPSWSAFIRKISSRLILFALAATLPLLIYLIYIWAVVTGLHIGEAYPLAPVFLASPESFGPYPLIVVGVFSSAIIWLTLWAAKVGPLAQTLFQAPKPSNGLKQKPSLPIMTALWSIPLLCAGLCAITWLYTSPLILGIVGMAIVYLAVAVVLTFVSGLFTENANSLHRLYRDRLNEAFTLGLQDEKAFELALLAKPFAKDKPRRPYPIINAAVNLQGSKKNRRGRNADFFIFTPDYIGSDATGYVSTAEFQAAEPHVDLATAVAISGAAVSSAMGRVGVPILAPTLALLNIRLGYWVRNPAFIKTAALARKAPLRDWKLSYLFYEMFGLLSEDRSKVLLSDGGHIDNLGLYQLLKRRCDIIVVSDAEADPAMNFSSLVDVERFARIDLGVRLDLPWQAIRDGALKRQAGMQTEKDESELSAPHGHAAIGKIFYPRTLGEPGAPAQPAKEGILLYVKSSVTGDERSYVLDYERRFPQFPHEATSDQFFSEEQFEAYRALGFHTMDRALRYSDGTDRWTDLLLNLRSTVVRE